MPIDLTPGRVLIELNGADPLHFATTKDVQVDVLDWDELRECGANYLSTDKIVKLHDRWETESPQTARSLRDELRKRGYQLPDQYNSDIR